MTGLTAYTAILAAPGFDLVEAVYCGDKVWDLTYTPIIAWVVAVTSGNDVDERPSTRRWPVTCDPGADSARLFLIREPGGGIIIPHCFERGDDRDAVHFFEKSHAQRNAAERQEVRVMS